MGPYTETHVNGKNVRAQSLQAKRVLQSLAEYLAAHGITIRHEETAEGIETVSANFGDDVELSFVRRSPSTAMDDVIMTFAVHDDVALRGHEHEDGCERFRITLSLNEMRRTVVFHEDDSAIPEEPTARERRLLGALTLVRLEGDSASKARYASSLLHLIDALVAFVDRPAPPVSTTGTTESPPASGVRPILRAA